MSTAQTSRGSRTWLVYAVLAVVALSCLVIASARTPGPLTPEDRVNSVAKTIKCPTCQGESVADSNAPASREIRRDIADRLSRGESADQIRAFYATSYGEAILLTPSRSGVTSVVWVLPVVVLVGAVTALVVAFRRWRSSSTLRATADDRAVVAQALAELDASRPTSEPSP
jgi:cytochrome c-type biogenesis protein CcmH